jgi:hypothetical protein
MTRLHINIKDSKKAVILIDLLKELPFVEIESSTIDKKDDPARKKLNLWKIYWDCEKIKTG